MGLALMTPTMRLRGLGLAECLHGGAHSIGSGLPCLKGATVKGACQNAHHMSVAMFAMSGFCLAHSRSGWSVMTGLESP